MFAVPRHLTVPVRILRYFARGRRPWSVGYQEYKQHALRAALKNPRLLDCFARRTSLPPAYGVGLDERIVEYPWLLTRLHPRPSRLLDAGATLNHAWIVRQPALAARRITICTLTPEPMVTGTSVDHVYADLRYAPFRAGTFDEIACLSTLEHIGLDNARVYRAKPSFNERDSAAYLEAIREFKRLLRPGGRLFVTVPFGRRQFFGWQQQFDAAEFDRMVSEFDGSGVDATFFKYTVRGWQRAEKPNCAECEYYDVWSEPPNGERAAAAGAVACVELMK